MMPGFFKLMPHPKKGKWEISVWKTSFLGEREIWTHVISGLLRAYIAARLMALYYDITTESFGGEIGIDWKIREIKAQ